MKVALIGVRSISMEAEIALPTATGAIVATQEAPATLALRDRLDEIERRERLSEDRAERRARDHLAIWLSLGFGTLVVAFFLLAEQRGWIAAQSLAIGSWAMTIALIGLGLSAIGQAGLSYAAWRRSKTASDADRSRTLLPAE